MFVYTDSKMQKKNIFLDHVTKSVKSVQTFDVAHVIHF